MKSFQPLAPEWLDQRLANYFECDPNLSLVSTSRPKPQTTYEEKKDWMIFGSTGS